MIARRAVFAAVFGLSLAGAPVVAAAADAPALAPAPAEEASLQGFGAANPACPEWSDGCFVCARDGAGASRCSTAGIACQSQAIACRRSNAAQ